MDDMLKVGWEVDIALLAVVVFDVVDLVKLHVFECVPDFVAPFEGTWEALRGIIMILWLNHPVECQRGGMKSMRCVVDLIWKCVRSLL